jgi:hypothetical protein
MVFLPKKGWERLVALVVVSVGWQKMRWRILQISFWVEPRELQRIGSMRQ